MSKLRCPTAPSRHRARVRRESAARARARRRLGPPGAHPSRIALLDNIFAAAVILSGAAAPHVPSPGSPAAPEGSIAAPRVWPRPPHRVIPRPDRAALPSAQISAGARDLLDERRGLGAVASLKPTSHRPPALLPFRAASATGLARPRLDPSALRPMSRAGLTCALASG